MAQIHISESNITIENKIFSGSHFAHTTVRHKEVNSYGEEANKTRSSYVKLR